MQTRKYQWKKKEVDQPTSLHLAKELNVSKVISEILVARGIHDFDSAQNYFRPNETQFQDGFLMKGMDVSVERLNKAISNRLRCGWNMFSCYDGSVFKISKSQSFVLPTSSRN